MKELFSDLQQFKDVELYERTFWLDTDKCFVRHTQRGTNIVFCYKGYIILVSEHTYIQIMDSRSDKIKDWRIPYKCEDKNEFFQLSTKYDYGNMNYEDLISFHDLCDFMIKRDLRERK